MDKYEELEKKGYAICEVEDFNLFKKLTDSFVKNINIPGINKKNITEARRSLAKMSKAEINKSMINFLTFNKNLSEMMINSFPNLIENQNLNC